MKRIDSIKIKNIKGIDDKTFDLNIIPDKPSIIVAPNGFGKSSITAAFKSLNSRRIDLGAYDCHMNDETLAPELELDVVFKDNTKTTLKADKNSNSIHSIFDVFVINNQLIPKSVKKNQGRFTSVTTTMEVEPVVLIDKIIAKCTIFNFI
jgi:predicted ATP-binding protein involved in virulence